MLSWVRDNNGAIIALFVVIVTGLSGCKDPPTGEYATSIERGEVIYDNCESCHGEKAHGRKDIDAPAIAGLPQWYIESQVQKFRYGMRGYHPTDTAGLRMRPMSKALDTNRDITAVAKYVASLPPLEPERTMKGDPENGKQHYEACVSCHGENASGKQSVSAPPLTLQQDWYSYKQIKHFKSGKRGAPPAKVMQDTMGAQMASIAKQLPDKQAIRDVVAYIQTLD